MENKYSNYIEDNNSFDIFKKNDVQKHFADLNIELLKGSHIDSSNHSHFMLLENYYEEFKEYYSTFYRLLLDKKTFENKAYYFLDFFLDSKGILSSNSRHKELTAIETITAITLLNMYYERQFEKYKVVSFSDIREKIKQSEFNKLYKRAFFKNGLRQNFTKSEWARVQKNIKNVISDFEQLGWVKELTIINENDFSFVLNHSIHRFQLMYEYEISNLEEFINNLQPDDNE